MCVNFQVKITFGEQPVLEINAKVCDTLDLSNFAGL